MISERRLAILNLIIEHYIRTGEPVGSKTLCSLLPYSVSSATVRNEMAYLSELGYLEQRHTSGGRVPSKASYRFYVDHLMTPDKITDFEKQMIDEKLSVNSGDPERLLADAAKLLSQYTNCAGFCCLIEDPLDCIQGVDLIPAGNSKAMLVMLTAANKVKSSLINIHRPINDDFRYLFYEIIKRLFAGATLSEVNTSLIQRSVLIAGEKVFDILPVMTSLCSLCEEASKSHLAVEGETNLLSHDEFGADVYKIISFLTDREKLIDFSKMFAEKAVKYNLFIGDENPIYELKNTSTAIAKFTYGNNQKATLGLIGSTRIDYKKIIPRMEYIFNTVERLLSSCH